METNLSLLPHRIHYSEDKELDEFEKNFTMADLDIEEKEAGEGGAEEGAEERADKAEAEDEGKEEVRKLFVTHPHALIHTYLIMDTFLFI